MADYWKRRKLTQDEYNGLKNELPDDELINITDSSSANLALQGVQFGAGGGGGGAPTTAAYLTAGDEHFLLPNSVDMGLVGVANNPNLLVNTPSGGVASFTGVQAVPGTVLVTRPTGEISFETTINTDNNSFEINAGTGDLITIAESTSIQTGTNLVTDPYVVISKAGGVDVNCFAGAVDVNSPNITLSNGSGASVMRMSSVLGFSLDTDSLTGEILSPDFTILTGTGSSVVVNAAGTALQSTTEVSSLSPINTFSNGAGTPQITIDSSGISGTTEGASQDIAFLTDTPTSNVRLGSGNNIALTAVNQVSTNSATSQLNSTVSHTVVTPQVTMSNGVGTPKLDVRAIGVTLETEGASQDINITASGTGSKINMSAVGAAHTVTLETAGITSKSPTIKQWNGTGTPTIQTSSTGIDLTTSATGQDITIAANNIGSSLNLTGAGGITFTTPDVIINTTNQFLVESPFISLSDAGSPPSLLLNGGVSLTAAENDDVTITSSGTGNNLFNSVSSNNFTAPNNTLSNGGVSPSIQVLDSVSGIQINGRSRNVNLSATTGNIQTETTNGNITFTTTVNGNYSVTSNTTIAETAATSIVNQSPINRLYNGAGTPTIEALTTGVNLTTTGLPIAIDSGLNGNISLNNTGTGTIALTSATSNTATAPINLLTTGGGTPNFVRVETGVNRIQLQANTGGISLSGGAYTFTSTTSTWSSTTNAINATTSFISTSPINRLWNGGTTPSVLVNTAGVAISCSGLPITLNSGTNGSVTITSAGTGTSNLNSAASSIMQAPITRMWNGGTTPSVLVNTTGITASTSGLPISVNSGTNGNISLTSAGTGTNTATSAVSNTLVAPINRIWNGATTPTVETLTTGINLTTSGLPIAVNTGTNGNFTVTTAGTGTVALTSAVSNTMTSPINTLSSGGGTPNYIRAQTTGNAIELQANTNPVYINGGAYAMGSSTVAWAASTSFVLTTPATTISNGGTTPAVSTGTTFAALLCNSIGAGIVCRTTGNVIDLQGNNNPIAITSGTAATTITANTITIPSIGTGTGTALVRDASNNLVRDSSSLRYKENVRNLEVDSAKIYNLNAKNFNFKSQPDLDVFGWIAEEAYEVLPELVNLNEDGEPESIRYAQATVLIIEEMKRLRNLVDTLAAQVQALTNP